MLETSFNAGWTVRPGPNRQLEIVGMGTEPVPVTLPHDALIELPRDPSQGAGTAFFPSGTFDYSKTLVVPAEWRSQRAALRFEGIYRSAMVYVNGEFAASQPSGYSEMTIPLEAFLRYGEDNTIRVVARAHDDSRWYSGAGIHRDVVLLLGGAVHVAPDGVAITTPDVGPDGAVVSVVTEVVNETSHTRTVEIATEVVDAGGTLVSTDRVPFTVAPGTTGVSRRRLFVSDPRLWGPDTPDLYTCRIRLLDGDAVLDTATATFGIRSLALDTRHGLRINGETVKLRGACVHHDNGPLGAATIGRADERRVEILKAAGFNALRSAHNPMSRAMLRACDRLGVLVMDELFDMWAVAKNDHDHSLAFADRWESEVDAMVRKDRNHPSVVLYSIGNEIPEATTPLGSVRGRALVDRILMLDATRFTTNAVSPMISLGQELFEAPQAEGAAEMIAAEPGPSTEGLSPTEAGNTLMAIMNERIEPMMLKPIVTERTAEPFASVDVAGYNYLFRRYRVDVDGFPNRVIVGTETHSANVDLSWALVEALPQVIGDFSWTGWEYLGEVGIGRTDVKRPGDDPMAPFQLSAGYPWLVSGTGDIDITGHRRPISYFKEIAFGLRAEPYIAVQRPEHHDAEISYFGAWSWSDSLSSWSWPGHEGAPVRVEVYSPSDEVELLLNGVSVGRLASGPAHRFRAEFETVYEPGELVAVGFTDGVEAGRTILRSASGPVFLEAGVDRPEIRADDTDLAYIEIALVDHDGVVQNTEDRVVTVEVSGPALLRGLGSADPKPLGGFSGPDCQTFDGRVLAVIRPMGAGTVAVTVTASGCEPAVIDIEISEEQP